MITTLSCSRCPRVQEILLEGPRPIFDLETAVACARWRIVTVQHPDGRVTVDDLCPDHALLPPEAESATAKGLLQVDQHEPQFDRAGVADNAGVANEDDMSAAARRRSCGPPLGRQGRLEVGPSQETVTHRGVPASAHPLSPADSGVGILEQSGPAVTGPESEVKRDAV